MKTTVFIVALAAILITGCASNQPVADTTSNSDAAQSSKHMPYHGTIMAIDMNASTVTVKTDQGTMTMTINADTKFRGGSKTLSDFKVGDQISGTFMDESGTMMAISMKPYSSK